MKCTQNNYKPNVTDEHSPCVYVLAVLESANAQINAPAPLHIYRNKTRIILTAFFGFLKTNYVIQQQQNTKIHASPAFVFNFSFHVWFWAAKLSITFTLDFVRATIFFVTFRIVIWNSISFFVTFGIWIVSKKIVSVKKSETICMYNSGPKFYLFVSSGYS